MVEPRGEQGEPAGISSTADLLQAAVRTAEAAEQMRVAARTAQAIVRAAMAVAREVELDRVVAVVLDQTAELLGARVSVLLLTDPAQTELRRVGHRGLPPELVEEWARRPLDARMSSIVRAARRREIQIVGDVLAIEPAEDTTRKLAEKTGIRSLLAIPLVSGERLVGVLACGLPEPRQLSLQDITEIQSVASVLAIGLANAVQFDTERRLRRQLHAVADAVLAIANEYDLQAVVQTIADRVRTVVDAQYAAVGIVAPGGANEPFSPWAFSGMAAEQAAVIGRLPRPVGLLGAVPFENRTIRSRDLRRDSRFRGFPPGHPEMTSFLGVPIRIGNQGIGNIYVTNKLGAEEFTEEDQQALELLARHASLAVDHARLYQQVRSELQERTRTAKELQVRLRQQECVAKTGQLALCRVELPALMERTLAMVVEALEVDHAAVFERQSDHLGLLVAVAGWPERLVGREIVGENSHVGYTLASGEPVIVEDASTDTRLGTVPLFREYGIVSGASVIVPGREGPYGVLGVYATQRRGFAPEDIRFLQAVASVLANAIERRRTDETLYHRQQELVALVENAPDVIARYDRQFRCVYINPAIEAVTGLSAASFIGRPLEETGAPLGTVAGWQKTLKQVFETGQSMVTEVTMKTPEGLRHYQVRLVPEFGKQGRVEFVLSIARDITERVRAEQEREQLVHQLAAERGWLRAVIERSPVAIFLLEGPDGQRVTTNKRGEALFGAPLTPDQGLKGCLRQLYHPDGTPVSVDRFPAVRALRGETVTGEELVVRRPDGREIPVLVSAAPIRDSEGGVRGAVSVVEDITYMKELARLREEWTSIIAHDLRQPLQAITLFADTLIRQGDRLDAFVRKPVEHIRNAACRLDRMIADLLDVSRLETRQLELRRQPVDLSVFVPAVIERTVGSMEGHPVRVEMDQGLPIVDADPSRLEQILGNLLSNAAKYGYPGTEIVVQVQRRDGELEITVTNQGEGIPAEDLRRVFDRFHRTQWARRERTGLGLGLYITKGLVEAHGGRIWAESTPRQTTSFHFTLPVSGTGSVS